MPGMRFGEKPHSCRAMNASTPAAKALSMRMRRTVREQALLLALVSSSCVGIPQNRVKLDRALHFADLAWSVEGAGCDVRDDVEGVTLVGGPGAIVVALDAADYRVHVEVNLEKGGNSGVFLRGGPGFFFPKGVEIQIDPADPKNPTGSIYGRVRSRAPIPPPDTWFTIDAVAEGSHVDARIDGIPSAASDDVPADGPLFGLQAHYPGSVVHFRHLEIESLR